MLTTCNWDISYLVPTCAPTSSTVYSNFTGLISFPSQKPRYCFWMTTFSKDRNKMQHTNFCSMSTSVFILFCSALYVVLSGLLGVEMGVINGKLATGVELFVVLPTVRNGPKSDPLWGTSNGYLDNVATLVAATVLHWLLNRSCRQTTGLCIDSLNTKTYGIMIRSETHHNESSVRKVARCYWQIP